MARVNVYRRTLTFKELRPTRLRTETIGHSCPISSQPYDSQGILDGWLSLLRSQDSIIHGFYTVRLFVLSFRFGKPSGGSWQLRMRKMLLVVWHEG